MLPVLAHIGFVTIYTFGVFLVLALFWGSFLLWKNLQLTSFDEETVFDGIFIALLGGLFFGRLLFVFLHFSDFGFSILRFILINGYPGLHPIGLIAGGVLTYWFFCNAKKITFKKSIDYLIPPLLLAIGIITLGSFFGGGEVGAQTNFFLSVRYPNLDGARHLVALYESVAYFGLAYVTQKIIFSIRREHLFEGFNLLLFVWGVALTMCAFDWMKAFRTTIFGYSFTFVIGFPIALTTTIYLIYYFRVTIKTFFVQKFSKRKK
ncbi:prolipoprotein diacylglyceryl transferase [Candidatus Woesebacteria bacterium]|nr:prolipoprotein diacylglyceryl transferase [Candidatus Woesebacteria bacterium]